MMNNKLKFIENRRKYNLISRLVNITDDKITMLYYKRDGGLLKETQLVSLSRKLSKIKYKLEMEIA